MEIKIGVKVTIRSAAKASICQSLDLGKGKH